MTVTYCTCSF